MTTINPIPRRALLALAASAALFPSLAFAQQSFDLTSVQKGQPRTEAVPEAVKLLKDVKLAKPGTFTVATTGTRLPFGINATDNQKIIVGSEPDIGRLVADGLGLELEVVQVAWADWPLGVISGKYDAAIANVTVTEQRKERFDFSTYRKDQLGFYVSSKSAIKEIAKAEDVAGLKVIVSSGTNQEQILLRWIKSNEAKGLKTTEIQYYDDDVVLYLALESGRADAYFGPNGTLGFKAAQTGNSRLVVLGRLAGGRGDRGDDQEGRRAGRGDHRGPQRADQERQLPEVADALGPRTRGDRALAHQPAGPAQELRAAVEIACPCGAPVEVPRFPGDQS
jgi:polar amino acid transport system substrate-binding protein